MNFILKMLVLCLQLILFELVNYLQMSLACNLLSIETCASSNSKISALSNLHLENFGCYDAIMNMENDIMTCSLSDKPNIIKKILGYLDYESLKQAEDVCLNWKSAIFDGKLWGKLYERNIKLPDWKKMIQVLKLRNSTSSPLPFKDDIEYQKDVCCQIGDSIKKLEANWSNGIHTGKNYSFNTTPIKKKINKLIHFSMNQRWIMRVLPDGRIGMRNRWAPEEEHIANLLPNNNIPIDDDDQHPVIESVQFNDEIFVAVGVIGSRKIVFVFEVKEQEKSPLLRCSAWRVIENTDATDNLYIFDSKLCIRLKGDLLLLCGKKIADLSTVVSLMNVRTKNSIYKNNEISSRSGLLTDFSLDDWRVVLFFGKKETPRSSRIDRYLLQIRDSATFMLLRSFVLPIVQSDICHFDYSSGFVVTGSDDSPIRIWNATGGTCDGNFQHGGEILSSLRIVADRLIITCDGRGIVKLWNMYAALNPETRDNPSRVLLRTLETPISPYWTFRQVKSLGMEADEFQIALILQYDNKSPQLYLMDFFADSKTIDEECQKTPRPNRKRRQV